MPAIGYGAMLAEGLVAVLALSVITVMSADDVRGLTSSRNWVSSFSRSSNSLRARQPLLVRNDLMVSEAFECRVHCQED